MGALVGIEAALEEGAEYEGSMEDPGRGGAFEQESRSARVREGVARYREAHLNHSLGSLRKVPPSRMVEKGRGEGGAVGRGCLRRIQGGV